MTEGPRDVYSLANVLTALLTKDRDAWTLTGTTSDAAVGAGTRAGPGAPLLTRFLLEN